MLFLTTRPTQSIQIQHVRRYVQHLSGLRSLKEGYIHQNTLVQTISQHAENSLTTRRMEARLKLTASGCATLKPGRLLTLTPRFITSPITRQATQILSRRGRVP
jgi:hypothetical protein